MSNIFRLFLFSKLVPQMVDIKKELQRHPIECSHVTALVKTMVSKTMINPRRQINNTPTLKMIQMKAMSMLNLSCTKFNFFNTL